MATKKKKSTYRFLSALLIVAILLYVGFQAYRSIFDTVTTEMVSSYSVYESIKTDGIVFRTETVIPPVSNGYAYYSVENGTRISKGGEIASVYSTEDGGLIARQIADIDSRIASLKSLQSEDAIQHLSLDLINSQIINAVNVLVTDAEDGSISDSLSSKTDLLTLLSKKQMLIGSTLNVADAIAALESEKQQLQQQSSQVLSRLTAPVAGYFVDCTDGYESVFSGIDPTTLTVDAIEGYLQTEPETAAASGGKIVGGYEWYLGCVVSEDYYNTLAVGNNLTVRMAFVTDEEIPVTVASCKKNTDGMLAVVFRCVYMSEELSTVRKETVEIQLVEHTGLKVPKRAIVINDDMQAGVYVRTGNVVSFRKIKQLYSEPADYVICEDTQASGYLHLYDDIIVEGRGIYEGKIIH